MVVYVDNNSPVVPAMAWRPTDYKSLHEPIMRMFYDNIVRP